jgi:hypothetical protein
VRRAIVFLVWLVGGLVLGGAIAWGLRDWWLAPILVARFAELPRARARPRAQRRQRGRRLVDNLLVTASRSRRSSRAADSSACRSTMLIVDF